jgi:hypothetical protein
MKNICISALKTKVMNNYRFCERIYNGGFEDQIQFVVFKELCQNHLDLCNFWYNKKQPKLWFITKYFPIQQTKEYIDLWLTCSYTVEQISNMINTTQESFNKMSEIEELKEQLEIKMHIENSIVKQIKENDIKELHEELKQNPIGFNSPIYNDEENEINIYDNEEILVDYN